MFSLVNSLIEKCLFTLVFILGVQVPEFINQYIQRLSGHLEESKEQLKAFQLLAEQFHQGDLSLLIKQYRTNSDPMIMSTAELIEKLESRFNYLNAHISALNTDEYLQQLLTFFTQFDHQLLLKTAEFYQLAIPLNTHALATGFLLALITFLLNTLIMFYAKRYIHLATRSAVKSKE